MAYNFRCDCPFTSAIDILGDKWMLVIVKQMLIEGRTTFTDFIESEESIATNILSAKLKLLEDLALVTKIRLPSNKKTNLYLLTKKGLALAPVLVELALWSDKNLRDIHPLLQNGEGIKLLRQDKQAFTEAVVDAYREKLANLSDTINQQSA
jgi:DNA-binding HxlR family transcriptional regulator